MFKLFSQLGLWQWIYVLKLNLTILPMPLITQSSWIRIQYGSGSMTLMVRYGTGIGTKFCILQYTIQSTGTWYLVWYHFLSQAATNTGKAPPGMVRWRGRARTCTPLPCWSTSCDSARSAHRIPTMVFLNKQDPENFLTYPVQIPVFCNTKYCWLPNGKSVIIDFFYCNKIQWRKYRVGWQNVANLNGSGSA